MSTAVATLITEINDRLDSYGEGTTSLAAAITDTTGTTFTFDDTSVIRKGDWLSVDNEVVEVMDVDDGTVRRGARGSTAATHLDAAVVRVNVIFPNHRVLGALNSALGRAYPYLYELVEDITNLVVVADQYEYDIPSTTGVYIMDKLWRVEIESETNDGVYIPIRKWEMIDRYAIRIYDINAHTAGQVIKLIGTKPFAALTLAGNLDADFPDTNDNATEYLVVGAMARLLTDVQAQIGRRDSFKGITDSFQNSQPFMSIATAKELQKDAERLLKRCRMQLPQHYTPDPGRAYLRKGE